MPTTTSSALDGLIGLARLARATTRLEDFLAGAAETIAASGGFRVAAVNVYRPADDDFVVTCVTGPHAAHRELVGTSVPGAFSRRVLTEAFEIERVYFVPAGNIDWDDPDVPPVCIPELTPGEAEDAWQPTDPSHRAPDRLRRRAPGVHLARRPA